MYLGGHWHTSKTRKARFALGFADFLALLCKLVWRKGRDLNPRKARTFNGFQDRRNQPLCHPSVSRPQEW